MTLRRATAEDAAEITRLRALMYESWGEPPGAEWWEACERQLRERLTDDDFAAYVVAAPDGRLVAVGVGWVDQHLPSPKIPTGRRGHVASMSTEPAARGQGHGRRIVAALLDWFHGQGIDRVDLFASPMGEPLYRSLGFTDLPYPAMTHRR